MVHDAGSARESAGRETGKLAALSGRLTAVSLFDLCQFLMLNRKTGTLTVRSVSGTAYLIFSEGQLLNAVDDTLRDGEGVVLRAVQWTEGSFEFAPGPVPPHQRIQASTENILLEAARKLDEMQAGAEGQPGSGTSAEESFRQKQERAASLGDAFRTAVGATEAPRRGQGWRDEIRRALARPEVSRALLGPGIRAGILLDQGWREVEGAARDEVQTWVAELSRIRAPGPGGPATVRTSQRCDQPDGSVLWIRRHSGPEGEWAVIRQALRNFPGWDDLGLSEGVASELESADSGLTLTLGAPAASGYPSWTGEAALAAWLCLRARSRQEIGWVVEPLPRYDWSVLPGRLRSLPPEEVRRPGALSRLCLESGAGLLVLSYCVCPSLLSEAVILAAGGTRVLLLDVGRTPGAWLRATQRRLGPETGARELEEQISGVWIIQHGATDSGLPLLSRFSTARTPAPKAAASA